ncbi:MAG: flagellar protein, partial [Spirochaetales bacterium]|nr:flagellar protein [Spirochaetales bacterium]
VQPPFEIPAYMQKDENDTAGSKFDGYGVIKNVGAIKSISMNVYGSNFTNGLGLIIRDENGEERNVFMDYLNFKGWRQLGWANPAYIDDVRNRELKKFPLYPRTTPMRQLVGFILYKDAAQDGGDVITYIKDVSLTYDLAVLPGVDDIDNEELWGILGEREESRRTAEWNKLGEKQVLRALEDKLLHRDPDVEE